LVTAGEDIERDHFAALEKDDGMGLHLFVASYGTPHLEITGRPPRYRDGRRYSPHKWTRIGCSPSRAPSAMARDIERRLLPHYAGEYAKAVRFIQETERGEDAALTVATTLATILGTTRGPLQKSCVQVRMPVTEADLYGHFEVRAGEPPTVGLVLHGLPLAQAEHVARALATAAPEAPREEAEESP
jgi:hypothetical protein